MSEFQITRKIEIDAAHRVPDHASKCFAVHGHRYVIEASCMDHLIPQGEQKGMVMDFGFLKGCMMKAIHDPCDHGIILYEDDHLLKEIEGSGLPLAKWWKMKIIDCVPTAENLAMVWYYELQREIDEFFETLEGDLRSPHLQHLTVWETPNCWARYPV